MTCNILDVGASFLYLPGCMVISFDDQATHTSDVYIVREKQGIELDKLRDVFEVFREVVLASITVEKGITKLDDIKKRPKRWSNW